LRKVANRQTGKQRQKHNLLGGGAAADVVITIIAKLAKHRPIYKVSIYKRIGNNVYVQPPTVNFTNILFVVCRLMKVVDESESDLSSRLRRPTDSHYR